MVQNIPEKSYTNKLAESSVKFVRRNNMNNKKKVIINEQILRGTNSKYRVKQLKKMLEAEVCTAMNMGMKVAFYLGHLVRRQIYKFP